MFHHYLPVRWTNPTVNVLALTTYRGFEHKYFNQQLSQVVFCQQIHSDRVIQVKSGFKNRPTADAMITDQTNLGLGVFTADCVPVFIHDQKQSVIGIAHAGWRGTIDYIASKTLFAMKENFGTYPPDCQVHFGPAIQRCCYQVDGNLADRFAKTFGERVKTNDNFLDLTAANQIQLQRQGIPIHAISQTTDCTACRTDLFYSYRAESTNMRMISLIALITGELS